MMMNRLEFLTFAAAGVSFAPHLFAAENDCACETYPGWKPGEMDIHFIHTGRGENCFYILPDGTTILCDTGDYFRPGQMSEIPWMPKGCDELLGGDIVARYIRRLLPSCRTIDYGIISHWHSDHTGAPELRSKTTEDDRNVCGMALVGEFFDFGRFYDHQFPNVGKYNGGDAPGRKMIREWVEAKKIPQEPFRPGALNQLKMVHDTRGRYRDNFSIRNICANAVCWTGKGEESLDYGAVHAAATGRELIENHNTLSMGFVIRYGKFSYFTGGDVSHFLTGADGKEYNYEAVVGRAVGPVTVCKTNHHAFRDAMTREFVQEVRAQAYVTCVWAPSHIQDCNMKWISSRQLYPGERTLFCTQVPDRARKAWPEAKWWKDVAPQGHVVVKVAPGGDSYRVYVLESADESMRVKRCSAFRPASA